MLIQPSPIHAISVWVILQKLIYTAEHNSHKSVADRLNLLSNQPAIKFSEGLPKNVQAERVNVLAYHIHWEYNFYMPCLEGFRYVSKKALSIFLNSFEMFVLYISVFYIKKSHQQ